MAAGPPYPRPPFALPRTNVHITKKVFTMTETLARISARRPWLVIALWVVLVVVGGGLSSQLLDSATTTELRLGGGAESEQAAELLETRLRDGKPEPVMEFVIIQSDSLTVDDPAFREKVESIFVNVATLVPDVVTVAGHYYLTNDETLVSQDRQTTIMPVEMTGRLEEATENVTSLLEIVHSANEGEEYRVLLGGSASIAHESNELATEDLEQGERIGVPVALIILLALFGAVVASLIPLGLGIVSIVIARGIAALIGQAFELVFFVTLMITMIGLAVGIDYSLFIVSRFREELDKGLDKRAAVARAGATAGRAVLFSGLTVVVALFGMLIVPATFFQSLGIGAIVVVLVAIAATLTFLPAVMSLLGDKVNFLSLPYFGRRRAPDTETQQHGFWETTTRIVTKVPILSFLIVAIPMVVAIVFYFQINTGINGVDTFPEGAETREAFFILEEEFSFGLVNPVEIVIDGDVGNPQVQEAIGKLEAALIEDPRFPIPPAVIPAPSGELALMSVAIHGEPSGSMAVDTVTQLREDLIPAAFAGVPADVSVGGVTAVTADLFDIVDLYTPIVFAFVLGLSFIILLLVFRSIVIPIKAVVMNLLSVGTAYGLIVLVFQKGVATDLLGFQHAEVIDVWIPLFLFTILFGLSMDYHVFLLSRIREQYDRTGDNAASVAYGLRSTASIITGAALIMVAVFGAFAAGETIINQQVGFGLAVAIFLDATLVRSVLVPASMEMLGRGNWYLPSWLSWLPDLRVEPVEE
ncbi:MAG: MMPL family transporter [Chloroflexi bacterium]|nr:MMPL family transporter [Chloroflexota bacterium]